MIKRAITKKIDEIKKSISRKLTLEYVSVLTVLVFVALFIVSYLNLDKGYASYFERNSIMWLSFIVTICLYIAGAERNQKKDKWFLFIIVVTILLSLCIYGEGVDESGGEKIFAFISYLLETIECILFHNLFSSKSTRFPLSLIVIILTVATYGLMFTDSNVSVWFDQEGIKHIEALGFMNISIFLIYIALIGIEIYKEKRKSSEKFVLIPVALVTLAVVITDISGRTSGMLPNIIGIDCLIAYIYTHLNAERLYEYKDEMADALRRSDLAHSQIQPHFMYNTLASIKSLYRTNPEEAEHLLNKFSSYLRTNIDSVDMSEPVLFEDELEHVKTYVEIELIRYSNEERHITVNYDIEDDDFLIPALSIQPFVENAIKYGVRSKKEGIVNISTYFDDNRHVIKIQDNGTGFDVHKYDDNPVENLPNGRKRRHVGIKNVKARLKTSVDADVVINSKIDEGTTVLIFVPNKKLEEE